MKKIVLLLVIYGLALSLYAKQDTAIERRIFDISKISGESPIIDGILSEDIWETAFWQSDFTQHFPYDGKKASFNTRTAIAYDADHIYVAVESFDPNPDSIVSRISRRDDVDGDFIFIDFDSYHDLRTCFAFIVSAGGSKGDFIMSNDGRNEDETWDPIWWVKTSITNKGWIAEMKIPFSQLRFDNTESGTWGLNIGRLIYRIDEMSLWQHIPREAPGFIHFFGELHGLKDVKPRKQAEIVPYVTGGIEKYEVDPEDPFSTGKNNILNTGVDAKIGVTNNLTLDLSLNPDFGQVEADPSEVNLTAYESFFQEKRPLFIEGKNIYSFPLRFGGGMGGENVFYSRRIGRRPHHYPELIDGEYSEQPSQTSILAAAKLSGKTSKGTSIGILESIALEEYATIDSNGELREEAVEPLTNYFVSRLSQDINDGNTIIGGIITSTTRNIKDEHLNFLPTSAITGGIDFQQYFKNRSHNIKLVSYFSHVAGTPEAITTLQESPARTFHRPGADYLTYDTTRTNLQGFGGNFQFWKTSGRLNYFTSVVWKSPGLELNDVGFLRSSDEIFQLVWVGYNWNEPFSIFRRIHMNADQFAGWDFGGNRQFIGFETSANASFINLWSAHYGFDISGEKRLNGILRGGPSMKLPGSMDFRVRFETNETKKLVVSPRIRFNKEFGNSARGYDFSMEFEYRPSEKLSLSAEPEFETGNTELQYVETVEFDDTERYVLANIDQKILMMSIRANLSITPDLTIQYWGQPFIASGKYSDFKHVTNSLAEEYHDRFHLYNENQIDFDNGEYFISEAGNELIDYSFENPDFNVKEFLSNLVIRWEYRPGSVLFLVWSQSRSGFEEEGDFKFRKHLPEIWEIEPTNVFLIKFSYRIGR